MGDGRIKPRDLPLSVSVTRTGVLTIQIGIDTLAHAALRSPHAWQMANEANPGMEDQVKPDEMFEISNTRGFAVDVKREMLAEAEDGSSLLTDLLDKATQKAIEEGSEFFDEKAEAP